jgi:hypothetical protein
LQKRIAHTSNSTTDYLIDLENFQAEKGEILNVETFIKRIIENFHFLP